MDLLTFTATATDADIPVQTLTYSLVGAPAGASMTSAGVFTWTPTEAQGPGDYTFDVVVSDGSLTDSETITVHVNEVNMAPILDPIGNKGANQGELLTFTATATDADIPAQTLTYSLSGAVPAGASITSAGVFTWTPSAAGDYTFDVVVSDGSLTDSETITVSVIGGGEPPVASFVVLGTYNYVSVDASASTGTIVTYSWDFGDGTSSIGGTFHPEIAIHKYATAGTKAITLTLTGSGGLTSVLTKSIAVTLPPAPPPPPVSLSGLTCDAAYAEYYICDVLITNLRTGGHMLTTSAGIDNPYGFDGYYEVDLTYMPGGKAAGDEIVVEAVSMDGMHAGTVTFTYDGSPSYTVDIIMTPGLASLPASSIAAASVESGRKA
jgi:PKD repeat protein